MVMKMLNIVCVELAATPLWAKETSAPSSHMVFNVGGDGDILINEVRVPKKGEAMYTYYETLGWSGLGAGYAGIQAHPKAHNFIFSIWDNKKHTAPIKAIHHGPGTETKKFGGEGTGRVATVPEPEAFVLQVAAFLSILGYRRPRGLRAAP